MARLFRVAKEIDDASGGPEQLYISPSLRPSYTTSVLEHPVTFAVPLIAGFGADGQYFDSQGEEVHVGFFQTGLKVSTPLNAMPAKFGSLTFSAGADVIFVTDEAINFRGNTSEVIGEAGLTYAY